MERSVSDQNIPIKNDPQETFTPENSNLKEAVGHTKRLINKLKRRICSKDSRKKLTRKSKLEH